MTPSSLRDRYLELIDQIVDTTLKGKIRSKEQVYRLLVKGVSSGTGEIFERCLAQRMQTTKAQLETKIKAARVLRALQTVQGQWERWQEENQANDLIEETIDTLLNSDEELPFAFLQVIDINRSQVFKPEDLKQLATALETSPEHSQDLQQLAVGIKGGLASFGILKEHLISWLYEQGRSQLGLRATPERLGPWSMWAKQLESNLPKRVFQTLAQQQSFQEIASLLGETNLAAWVELAIVLQYLQRSLVSWFDQQPYDAKAGKRLSISTYLTFAWIWGQLSRSFAFNGQPDLGDGCFQGMLQTLRTFSQRNDFPLYGGIFVSFSGSYLQETISYFDQPLKQVEGTQEKARILTLLGYSMATMGRYGRAIEFHQQALEIAREAEDIPCQVANLNHLSRVDVSRKNYNQALGYGQRALIMARQAGERLGEANALANVGYSQVFSAQELERLEPEVYEGAINYLEQGLQLSEKLGDRQSRALCLNSLGVAHLILEKPTTAISYLELGIEVAQLSGDVYLQGLNFSYLAEAYHSLDESAQAIYNGCLAMYLLEQISSQEWRQPAGLMSILQGKLGEERFEHYLLQFRPRIISVIGVDGYDHLPELIAKYQNNDS